MKIFVVDDVHENRVLIKTFLRMGGYSNIHTFGSAEEAFVSLGMENLTTEESDVDLILMDLMMPDIDGISACERIKSKAQLADVPIIMVTANTDSKSLEASFNAGAMDYIKKPLDKIELLTRVRSALRLKKEMDNRKQRERELLEVKIELEKANAELRRISQLDALTGILNRRVFDETLEYECRRVTRESDFISLIMFDIDDFKPYNDTYGHQTGDQCLRLIAQTLDQALKRTGDALFRYGGEEFAAILPNTDPKGARHVGEILREKVNELRIPHKTSRVTDHVTISVGIATLNFSKENTPFDLVEMADKALYEAKNAGRNRVKAISPLWAGHDILQ